MLIVRVDELDPEIDAGLNVAVAVPNPVTEKPPTVPAKLFTPAAVSV